MTDVLTVRDLRVDFALPGSTVHAVRRVDLAVGAGEVLALVGESGSGKSVTAAAVLGLLPRSARVSGGSVTFHGEELLGRTERRWNLVRGSGIGMIFQNPVTSLDPSFTVGNQLGATARHHLGLSRPEAHDVAALWLEKVGIPDAPRVLRAYPHELSGGMRQRVMIALAGLSGPDLLIADEPTTALDATVQKQVLDLLLGLTGETRTSVLLITHDFGVVAHTSDRVAVMRDGEIVETGPTERLLRDPEHPYTRSLVEAVPEIGERHRQSGGARRLLGGGRSSSTTTQRPSRPTDASVLLELAGVSKDFEVGGLGTGRHRHTVAAVRDVSLAVRRGETFGLIGESGSGKSTLARLAGGLLPLSAGEVRFDGADLTTLDAGARRALRRRFQYVFQDAATALNPRIAVGEQVARPLLRLGRASRRKEARALTTGALDLVGLPAAYADRYPRELSGGQRQRVGIARAVALEPELLVLDEPTSALDVSTQATILNLLLDLKDELDLTYLFIGHNLAVIELICDRIGVLRQGALVETVDADDLVGPDRHPATRALLDAVLPFRTGRSAASDRPPVIDPVHDDAHALVSSATTTKG